MNTDHQSKRWVALRQVVSSSNRFYRSKWSALAADATLEQHPFTTKAELVADQAAHPPYGSNLTRPLAEYTRLHQSSGTSTGRPLRWLDTPAGWDWVVGCWQSTFAAIGVTRSDRCYFPFSFGPFLGFWSAFEACERAGCFLLSGGGANTSIRLRQIVDLGITCVFCTPTYALHLLETARVEGIDLAASAVRTVVVAGEPGGNIASTKSAIEAGWGARLIDHYGMTEVGPVAYERRDEPGFLSVIEKEIIAEVIDPATGRPTPPGEIGELVVTNLGRPDSPLVRYRTGDLVRRTADGKIAGGVVGRADDMLHVRGNNLYPSAIEAVVRRFPEVAEFRIVVSKATALTDVEVRIEPNRADATERLVSEVAKALHDEFAFRMTVRGVPPGRLPRFEMKAKRVELK
jgi:phenylacetate-CoA ligase